MVARHLFFAMSFILAIYQHVQAAEKPPELIVGQWKIREHGSDVPGPPKTTEMFQFSADGKGRVSKATETKTDSGVISWSITDTFEHACVVKINYDGAPKEMKPLVLLLVFNGPDTVIFQARADRITYMDRQKAR
jgi:hypothetical protein